MKKFLAFIIIAALVIGVMSTAFAAIDEDGNSVFNEISFNNLKSGLNFSASGDFEVGGSEQGIAITANNEVGFVITRGSMGAYTVEYENSMVSYIDRSYGSTPMQSVLFSFSESPTGVEYSKGNGTFTAVPKFVDSTTPYPFYRDQERTVSISGIWGGSFADGYHGITLRFTTDSGTFTVAFIGIGKLELAEDESDGSGSSGSGSGSSSSSSSGGGGGGVIPATPVNTVQTVTATTASTETRGAVAAAVAAGNDTATVNLKNAGEISLENLQTIAAAANNANIETVKLQADSMSSDGKSVDVRISLDPTAAKTALNLSASTTNTAATQTTRTFTKFFENDVMTVALGQKAGFGQQVRIAAKLDPKLKTDNLVFYIFDPVNNNFQRIPEPKYYVDKNGYVHFTTSLSGNIVISDGPLTKK
ncbi:MAG: hypothetical protein FWH02_05620 [Oscillospiraceae bacterium]|nr:hypothetical protein [Oscillospiraceae bacterium]